MATSTEEQRLRDFKFEKVLKQDTGRKTLNLLGNISSTPAILIAEKTFFNVSPPSLASFTSPDLGLSTISLLDRNDIYHWFLASTFQDATTSAAVKLTLIYPATETHIRKYSAQHARMIRETPEVYEKYVSKYVQQKTAGGRLQWVENILTHKAEVDRILYEDTDKEMGFILLPDLKWDRITATSMYLMAVVHRTDITSIRSLDGSHYEFLLHLRDGIIKSVTEKFKEVKGDQVKLYVHYQPSYYHFHVHVVHIEHDMGASGAAGKAIILDTVIETLKLMGTEGKGYEDVEISYALGEEHELWQKVFGPLKRGEEPVL